MLLKIQQQTWFSVYLSSFCNICLFSDQLEEETQGKVRGEAQGGEGEPAADPEWGLKQEREEHRRLLAESHSASLDLRWKLQHGEKRWSRERAELLEHFERERQDWDGSMRELHRKMERVREGRGTTRQERRRNRNHFLFLSFAASVFKKMQEKEIPTKDSGQLY